MKQAYKNIGTTMFQGAVINICSGAFLFETSCNHFEKYAVILTCASAISFFVSLFLFGALMHICGPMRGCGDILYACRDRSGDDEEDEFDL